MEKEQNNKDAKPPSDIEPPTDLENMSISRGVGRGRGRARHRTSPALTIDNASVNIPINPRSPAAVEPVDKDKEPSEPVRRVIARGRSALIRPYLSRPGANITIDLPECEFKVWDLKRELDLSEYGQRELFYVISAESLNTLYVVPEKDLDLKRLKIADGIASYVDKAPSVTGKLCCGDVYLARKNEKSTRYFRTAIKEVLTGLDESKCIVRGVDNGRVYTVDRSCLKSVSMKIMKIPVLGYTVQLNDMPAESDLIFEYDFHLFMKCIRKIKMRLQIVAKEKEKDTYKVNLKRRDTKKNLAPDIMDLGKWEWERVFELCMYRRDDEIIKRGNWSACNQEFYCDKLPVGVHLEATLMSNVVMTSDMFIIVYLEIKYPAIDNAQKVLEAQSKRYFSKILASDYYPALGEKVFINFTGEEIWRRMIRLDQVVDLFYDVDYHNFHEIKPGDEGVKYRILPPEFTRIPKLVQEAVVYGLDLRTINNRDGIQRVMKRGAKLTICVDTVEEYAQLSTEKDDITPVRVLELAPFRMVTKLET